MPPTLLMHTKIHKDDPRPSEGPNINHNPVAACEHHKGCYLPKGQLLRAIKKISDLWEAVIPALPSEQVLLWLEGLISLDDVLERGLWNRDECRYCWCDDLLLSKGAGPLMVGLKYFGLDQLYKSAIQGLRTLGKDIEYWEEWIEGIIRGIDSERM